MGFTDFNSSLSGLVPGSAEYKVSPSSSEGEVQEFVTDRINEVKNQLTQTQRDFSSVLNSLAGLSPPSLEPITVTDQLDIDTSHLNTLSNTIKDVTAQIDSHIDSLTNTIEQQKKSHGNTITNLQDKVTSIANQITDIEVLDFPESPDNELNAPVIRIPDAPSLDNLPDSPDKPVLNSYGFPDKPDIKDPELPNMLNINLPSPPSTEFPEAPDLKTFSIDGVPDVSSWVDFVEENYANAFPELVDALKTLIKGGEGSEISEIEESLIANKRNLIDEEYKANIDESQEAFAKLGYSLPSGSVVKMLEAAKNKYLRDVSDASKEALEETLKIVQQNRQTGVSGGIELEKAFISLFSEKMNRAIDALRLRLEAVSTQFRLSLERVREEINAYIQETQAYKTTLEAELNKLEVYRAQLSGEEIKNNINLGLIELYKAEISGAESKINLYQSQIESIKTMYDAESQKVEMFKGEVTAYSEQLRAKSIEVDNYSSMINAELAKADIFKSKVDAYNSEVTAYATKVEAVARKMTTEADVLKTKTDALARIAELSVEVARMDTQFMEALVNAYNTLANLGNTVTQATSSVSEIYSEISKIQAELDSNIKQAQIQAQTATQEVTLKQYDSQIEQYKGMASTVGATLAALAGALNVSAQVSEESGVRLSGSISMNYRDSIVTEIQPQ